MKDSKLKDTPIVKKDKFSLKQCSVSYLKKKNKCKRFIMFYLWGESYVYLSLFSSQHNILVGALGRYVSSFGMRVVLV